jgi:ketosteroid isomerase-like protein
MPNLSKPTRFLVVLPWLSLIAATLLAEALPDPALVADAEKRFARAASEHGIRESFLQFFAEGSILLAPGPTDARTFYTNYKDKGHILAWQPVFATIARSGDLGVTTGPWQLKDKKSDPTAIAYGEFVSVWKQQPDHSWKVVFDCGIDHPAPTGATPKLQLEAPNQTLANKTELLAELEQAEKSFADTQRVSTRKALLTAMSDDIRVLRDESYPGIGEEMAEKMVTSGEPMTRKIFGGAVSEAADLAYRYGSYSSQNGNAPVSGSFLTIWRVESPNQWKIVLDLEKKTPPPSSTY